MPEIKKPSGKHTVYRVLALGTEQHVKQIEAATKKAGHEVVAVTSIREGIDFLNSENEVDAIVCETHLEHESVFEFLKKIKSGGEHEHIRFMMLCTNASDLAQFASRSVEHAATILGVDKYLLTKDFHVERLAAEINLLLSEHEPKHSHHEGENPDA